jgi:hypothetical protein
MIMKTFDKCGSIALLLLLAFGKAGISAVPDNSIEHSVRQPIGFFVMQQVDHQNISDAKLASPKWTGIVIRQRWSAVEPAANTFDWKFVDAQAARARKLGKKYILAIYTGDNDPKWLNVPLYLGAPYPWDAKMLSEHGKMVEQLGKRYAKDSDLVGVEIGGPTRAPSGSLEMHLATGLTYQKGYSEAKMIAAWKQCIDQYALAFPNCALISDGGVAPGGGRMTITQTVFDYLFTKYRDRANFSHCALKASMPEAALHHVAVANMGKHGARIGFETIGPSVGGANGENGAVKRFGGNFNQALQIAQRANAKWLKVYQADERNLPLKMPGN